MLRIPVAVLDEVLHRCRTEHPVEACGVLAGPVGGSPDEHIPMDNVHASASRFGFAADQQLAVWRHLADTGRAPVVIYHSHTASPATMSRTDVAAAAEPDTHYLVVSTAGEAPAVRAWLVVDGGPVEVTIEVVP